MISYDGACEIVSVVVGRHDDSLDDINAPYLQLRPDGVLVRTSAIDRTLRIVRVTTGGGLFICKDDDIVVQSLDLRTMIHIVPVSMAHGKTVRQAAPVASIAQNYNNRQMSLDQQPIITRTIVEETVDRAGMALVWPRVAGETVAALTTPVQQYTTDVAGGGGGPRARAASYISSTSSGGIRNRSFMSNTSDTTTTVSSSVPLKEARLSTLSATERAESKFRIASAERASMISNRVLMLDFPSRKEALKFFNVLTGLFERLQLPLIAPSDAREDVFSNGGGGLDRLSVGSSNEEDGNDEDPKRGRRHRRGRHGSMAGAPPGSSDEDDDGGGTRSMGSSMSDRDALSSEGDNDHRGAADRRGAAVTEASTNLRELFETNGDADDDGDGREERDMEAAAFQSRRGRKAADDDTHNGKNIVEEDTLQRESAAMAHRMIERLTTLNVIIRHPFLVTNAYVDNSAAHEELRRDAAAGAMTNAAAVVDSMSIAAAATDAAATSEEMMTLRRLHRFRGPLPVLEALSSRRVEYFDTSGMWEFFALCSELYRKERARMSHRAYACATLQRVGLQNLNHFTGPAIVQLFEAWALQRRREARDLHQYLVELVQYVWFLRQAEEEEGAEEPSPQDGTSLAQQQRSGGVSSTNRDVDSNADASTARGEQQSAPRRLLAPPHASRAAEQTSSMVSRTASVMSNANSSNPLTLYAAVSTSVEGQLDMCRRLHIEIEELLERRRQRYAAAGMADPLLANSAAASHAQPMFSKASSSYQSRYQAPSQQQPDGRGGGNQRQQGRRSGSKMVVSAQSTFSDYGSVRSKSNVFPDSVVDEFVFTRAERSS